LSSSESLLVRLFGPLLQLLFWPLSVSEKQCGDYMLYGLFKFQKGAWRMTSKGDDLAKRKYYGTEEGKEKLWEHTIEATNNIQN
jgi:hypothetical protein